MLVDQLEDGRAEVENQYVRSVSREGNVPAQAIMEEVFEVCDRKWRGIGLIPAERVATASGIRRLRRREGFRRRQQSTAEEPAECISAQVLQGLKKPVDCPAFGRRCTPETPLGRAHGLRRRRLRRLLPVPSPHGGDSVR